MEVMKLSEITEAIDGVLRGDGDLEIRGISGLVEAEPGELSFLANPKYAAQLAETRASAVIVGAGWNGSARCAVVRVGNPDKAMALAADLLAPAGFSNPAAGVHPSAVVEEDVEISENVWIGPCCVVESGAKLAAGVVLLAGCHVGRGAVIGEGCVIRANAVIREDVKLGKRVLVHEGAVLGSDGFGNYHEGGRWQKIPHIGTVEIGDDAEIGANVTIDRARFGVTVIGNGVKIDNLVQIAHNVRVGDHTAMAAQVGIAGSSTVGRGVMLGGQVGISGHVHVGDGAVVGAQSGVSKDVEAGAYVFGYPAIHHRKAAECHAHLMRLPEWKERVKRLEQRIEMLEKQLSSETGGPDK